MLQQISAIEEHNECSHIYGLAVGIWNGDSPLTRLIKFEALVENPAALKVPNHCHHTASKKLITCTNFRSCPIFHPV